MIYQDISTYETRDTETTDLWPQIKSKLQDEVVHVAVQIPPKEYAPQTVHITKHSSVKTRPHTTHQIDITSILNPISKHQHKKRWG